MGFYNKILYFCYQLLQSECVIDASVIVNLFQVFVKTPENSYLLHRAPDIVRPVLDPCVVRIVKRMKVSVIQTESFVHCGRKTMLLSLCITLEHAIHRPHKSLARNWKSANLRRRNPCVGPMEKRTQVYVTYVPQCVSGRGPKIIERAMPLAHCQIIPRNLLERAHKN